MQTGSKGSVGDRLIIRPNETRDQSASEHIVITGVRQAVNLASLHIHLKHID